MTNTTKIALITGGSRGLGRDMALTMAKKGTDILLTYHSRAGEASSVVDEIRGMGRKATALQLDAGEVAGFPEFFDALPGLLQQTFGQARFQYLVNNGGTGLNASFMETKEVDFDSMINIHVKGVFFFSQQALAHMEDGGAIVNVSSGLARFTSPNRAAYGSAKSAVETLSRYMAMELGPRRIRVNVVAPGAIATDFSGGIVRDNPQVNAAIAAQTALGRVGLPTDIGSVVAFLCSDDAGWVTGQRIEASGGMHL
jgi:NAD(P)-dependent dehydrogenase (short-subunit alcohol dehydrogenase family)